MDSNNKFIDWYNSQFRTGENLAQYLSHEISLAAAEIGVDWSAIEKEVTWRKGKKVNVDGSKLLKGFKNSVGVYASIERCFKTGVEYPTLTFKNKGGSGDTVTFSGIGHLWDLYREDIGKALTPTQQAKRDKQRQQRQEQAERKRQAALQKQKQEDERRAANVQKEIANHLQLPCAASFVYLDQKKIAAILNHVDVRTGTDKHGQFISFLLHDTQSKPRGVQRIYEKHITKPDGSKTNKDFTWGMDKSGAHLVIGDIANAERIAVVEGFATGASVFLALADSCKIAVVVALDAGNMIKTVDQYKAEQPHIMFDYMIDNDQWKCREGKGNAGALTAIELLKRHKKDKAYLPDFKHVDNTFRATDWNDLHQYRGLSEVTKQLKGNKCRFKLDGDIFEQALTKLKYVGKTAAMQNALDALTAGMQVGLPKYRPSDIVALIRKNTQHIQARINVKQLNKKATQIFNAKVKHAQSFRSFSSRFTDPKLTPDHITYTRFNQGHIDEQILDFINSKKGDIVILRFPMGSGKTQKLIKPMMWQNECSAFFAHRVSLIGGATQDLNRGMSNYAPVINYQEKHAQEMLAGSNRLACCINSAIKGTFAPLLNNLDASFFDEASQQLRHTTSGNAVAYPVAVFNKMLQMISTTRDHIVLADADANDTLVEFCELARKERNAYLKETYGEDYPDCKIHIVDGVTDCSDKTVFYTDADTAFHRAVKDVENGKKVLIANDSSADAEKLFQHLQERCPEKTGLLINSDSKPLKEVDSFCDSPNAESLKYDYVIYSPAISSGVSLENGHFERHYGIFCGTIVPSDAIQMIRRDRKANEFILGLATIHSAREENPLNMWIGKLIANPYSQTEVNINTETGKVEFSTRDFEFDRFRLELIAQENQAKNDFANNLLCNMFADNYKLKQLQTTEIEQEIGKALKEISRDTLKEINTARILNAKTPTESERNELLNRNNLSKEEHAQLDRWNIEKVLFMKVNEESIKFLNNGGLRKARTFELLQMNADAARNFDTLEIQNGVQISKKRNLEVQRRGLRDFFELAGFDIKTGTGEATPEKLEQALEHLTAGDNIHVFNNVYQFGGFINTFSRKKDALNKAKAIFDALGVKLDKKQISYVDSTSTSRMRYTLNRSDWNDMLTMFKQRQAEKVSGFNTDHLETMIHTTTDSYINNDDTVDHVETNENKASSWFNAIKNTLETLNLSIKHAPKLMVKLRELGHMRTKEQKQPSVDIVTSVYNQFFAKSPQKLS